VRLRRGLADNTLLLLRQDAGWLDFRYFASSVPVRPQDASVVWDQPEADLGILVVGGEGRYLAPRLCSCPRTRKSLILGIGRAASQRRRR
jgi:hypothetical protein